MEDLPTSEKRNEDGLGDVGSKGEKNSFGSRENFLSCASSKTRGKARSAISSQESERGHGKGQGEGKLEGRRRKLKLNERDEPIPSAGIIPSLRVARARAEAILVMRGRVKRRRR